MATWMEMVMWACSERTGGVQLTQMRQHWRMVDTLSGFGFHGINSAFCVEFGLPTRV